MSMRLRELIRAVRACKTAAEERAVIAKESALIRTAIKEEHDQYRHRNVAKLLFIHMLGYPSHFGQMECLKLIASPHFYEKRIGYLGLSLLLTETEEVLTLVTNSIKLDLNSPNPFVVGLALTAVGNLATEDIARDLAMDVDRLLRSSNSYLRKKAALATVRVLQRVPDLAEEFVDRAQSLIKDRSHGVLLAGIELMAEMVRQEGAHAQAFVRLVPSLVRLLRNLLTMGYAPDHDVAGITDPFLQVKLLAMLQLLGHENGETSEAMNDILAQVATNTETAKNAGNAILYQCVQTIMSVESETGLRVLAVNILGRFLLNRDNNIRYVALNTLSKVVARDAAAVQRHRNTIVDCLKDPDISIRQRALELIYQLVNEQNVAALVREMLNYLVVAPPEHKASICSKVMGVAETYAPSPRWRLDTFVTMLSLAGQVADAAIPHAVVYYVSTAPPHLQRYVAHKLFAALREDVSQHGLVTVAVWAVGEFGDLLLQDQPPLDDETPAFPAQAPRAVLEVLERVVRDHGATQVTRGYVLTALLKLSDRFKGAEEARLREMLATYETSLQLELQQRSVEFGQLLADPDTASLRPEVLARIPALNEAMLKARRARFAEGEGASSVGSPGRATAGGSVRKGDGGGLPMSAPAAAAPTKGADLLDLEDIFGGGPSTTTATTGLAAASGAAATAPATSVLLNGGGGMGGMAPTAAPPAATTTDLLSDIFSSSASISTSTSASASASAALDVFGAAAPAPSLAPALVPVMASPILPAGPTVTALDKDGLRITMELGKPNPAGEPQASQLLCRFVNSTAADLTGFSFQCAVPKYVALTLSPASATTVPAHGAGPVTQQVRVVNSMLGQKPLQLKIKVQYTNAATGQQVTELAQVAGFPDGY